MSITENLYSLVSALSDGKPIKKKTSLNLKKIEFIDGNKLKEFKRKAYDTLAKDPLVSFGTVLKTVENSIYSPQPESILRSNIQKFLSEENLYILEVDNTYKYRPDLLAQIFYGSQEYFHLVLMANGMKTFLEFVPEKTNNLVMIFKPAILVKILNY
jgi:hypothetical protein